MNTTVSGDNITEIVRAFKDSLNDTSSLLERVGDEVVFPSIKQNFDEEGRPKWAELSARTQFERAAEGFGPAHPILQRTGELLKTSATKEGAYTDLKETRYVISPLLKKAEWLNDGMGKLPARPFFFLQEEDFVKADRVVKKWGLEQIQKFIGGKRLTDLEAMYR